MFYEDRVGCLDAKFAVVTAHEKVRDSLTGKKGVCLRHLEYNEKEDLINRIKLTAGDKGVTELVL